VSQTIAPTKPPLISERTALIGSIALTLIAAAGIYFSVHHILNIIGHLFRMIFVFWLLGSLSHFWITKAYKDGVTVKELFMIVVFPLGWWKALHAESRWRELRGQHIPAETDNTWTIINEGLSRKIGIVLTVVGLIVSTVVTILSVLHILGALIWLGVIAGLAIIVAFVWMNKTWQGGMTWGDLGHLAIAPLSMAVKARRGARVLRGASV
jgi:hypothetical protein